MRPPVYRTLNLEAVCTAPIPGKVVQFNSENSAVAYVVAHAAFFVDKQGNYHKPQLIKYVDHLFLKLDVVANVEPFKSKAQMLKSENCEYYQGSFKTEFAEAFEQIARSGRDSSIVPAVPAEDPALEKCTATSQGVTFGCSLGWNLPWLKPTVWQIGVGVLTCAYGFFTGVRPSSEDLLKGLRHGGKEVKIVIFDSLLDVMKLFVAYGIQQTMRLKDRVNHFASDTWKAAVQVNAGGELILILDPRVFQKHRRDRKPHKKAYLKKELNQMNQSLQAVYNSSAKNLMTLADYKAKGHSAELVNEFTFDQELMKQLAGIKGKAKHTAFANIETDAQMFEFLGMSKEAQTIQALAAHRYIKQVMVTIKDRPPAEKPKVVKVAAPVATSHGGGVKAKQEPVVVEPVAQQQPPQRQQALVQPQQGQAIVEPVVPPSGQHPATFACFMGPSGRTYYDLTAKDAHYPWLSSSMFQLNGRVISPFGCVTGLRSGTDGKLNNTLLTDSQWYGQFPDPIKVVAFASLTEALKFCYRHQVLSTLQITSDFELIMTIGPSHGAVYEEVIPGMLTVAEWMQQKETQEVKLYNEFSFWPSLVWPLRSLSRHSQNPPEQLSWLQNIAAKLEETHSPIDLLQAICDLGIVAGASQATYLTQQELQYQIDCLRQLDVVRRSNVSTTTFIRLADVPFVYARAGTFALASSWENMEKVYAWITQACNFDKLMKYIYENPRRMSYSLSECSCYFLRVIVRNQYKDSYPKEIQMYLYAIFLPLRYYNHNNFPNGLEDVVVSPYQFGLGAAFISEPIARQSYSQKDERLTLTEENKKELCDDLLNNRNLLKIGCEEKDNSLKKEHEQKRLEDSEANKQRQRLREECIKREMIRIKEEKSKSLLQNEGNPKSNPNPNPKPKPKPNNNSTAKSNHRLRVNVSASGQQHSHSWTHDDSLESYSKEAAVVVTGDMLQLKTFMPTIYRQ